MDGAALTDSAAGSETRGGTTRGRTLLKTDSGFSMKLFGSSKPGIHYPVFITKENIGKVNLLRHWQSLMT